jgi:uncharacterized protein YegP (UPF0339 family)
MTFYLRRDAANQWRWRLRAANKRIIAESGEAYHNREDCVAAIALVRGSGNAPVQDE